MSNNEENISQQLENGSSRSPQEFFDDADSGDKQFSFAPVPNKSHDEFHNTTVMPPKKKLTLRSPRMSTIGDFFSPDEFTDAKENTPAYYAEPNRDQSARTTPEEPNEHIFLISALIIVIILCLAGTNIGSCSPRTVKTTDGQNNTANTDASKDNSSSSNSNTNENALQYQPNANVHSLSLNNSDNTETIYYTPSGDFVPTDRYDDAAIEKYASVPSISFYPKTGKYFVNNSLLIAPSVPFAEENTDTAPKTESQIRQEIIDVVSAKYNMTLYHTSDDSFVSGNNPNALKDSPAWRLLGASCYRAVLPEGVHLDMPELIDIMHELEKEDCIQRVVDDDVDFIANAFSKKNSK